MLEMAVPVYACQLYILVKYLISYHIYASFILWYMDVANGMKIVPFTPMCYPL